MNRERIVPTLLGRVLGNVMVVAVVAVALLGLVALASVLWRVIVS